MKDIEYLCENGIDDYNRIWHKNEKNMIMYINSGKASIVFREKNYMLFKGMICFVGAKKYHYTFPINPHDYCRNKIFVSEDIFERITKLLSYSNSLHNIFTNNSFVCSVLNEEERIYIEKKLNEINKYGIDSEIGEANLICLIIKILISIKNNITELQNSNESSMLMATEYINNNIFSNISIDDICSSIHLSKYYFCRRFKETVGLTVMDYILKTRITLAKELLTENKQSIGEICNYCGFSCLSYFSRVFKDETGLTPTQYRKSLSQSK